MPALNFTKIASALQVIGGVAALDQITIRCYTAKQEEVTITIKTGEALDITVSGPLTTVQKNEIIAGLVQLFKAP